MALCRILAFKAARLSQWFADPVFAAQARDCSTWLVVSEYPVLSFLPGDFSDSEDVLAELRRSYRHSDPVTSVL